MCLSRGGTMTLLAAITNHTQASTPAAAPAHPLVLVPGVAPPPATSSALPTLIPPSVWTLSPADTSLATAAAFLTASLSSVPTVPRFRTLLTSFLAALSESLSLPAPTTNLPKDVLSFAPYFPASVASIVASAAARLAEYDLLLALAGSRLLPHPPQGLLSSLSEAGRPDVVCAVLRHATDLRSAELLSVLRCFLSPAPDEAYLVMVSVKSQWKDAAVLAINRSRDRGAGLNVNAVAKQAALLLMMGHDGFTAQEVCLHYLFASQNVEHVDSVVLAAAVSELDGGEVSNLMKYLAKWIGKYRKFPEAQACPEALGMIGLEQCDSVPSFGVVARAMGLVLDQHFSHLVLNAEVREDLRAAESMVKELAAEAVSSAPILELLRRMKQNV